MTTPLLPVVHEMPDQSAYRPNVRRRDLTLGDYLALGEMLTDAGYPVGDTFAKADQIVATVLAAITSEPSVADLGIDSDPAEVAERIRQAGVNRANAAAMSDVFRGFEYRLAATASAALNEQADQIVAAMHREFDPALEAVQIAHGAGLAPTTDTAGLLESAPPKVIDAYRRLGPAVTVLDRIGRLRTSLTMFGGIGPVEHPIAAFVAGLTDASHLDGAQATWQGESEHVQVELGSFGATSVARRPIRRLGGGWLALVSHGYKVRLNTGDEAHAVVQNALA